MRAEAGFHHTSLYIRFVDMKRTIIAASLALAMLSISCREQDPSFPEFAEVKAEDVNVLQEHPRIMLFKGQEQQIREKISRDPFLQEVHDAVMYWSDSYITEEPMTDELIDKRLLPKSRQMLMRIFCLSYSYRMTGDERYARCAEAMMLNVCSFGSWNPWYPLDPAEMLMAMAIGYDWLYDQLSEESREIVRNAMKTKAIDNTLPEKCEVPKYMRWLKNHTNINAVCNTAIATAGIAMFEDCPDYCRRIICRSVNNARSHTLTEYMPDGNYPEGYMYWNYGTSFLVLFQDILEKATGIDFGLEQTPGFLKSGKYMLHMTTNDLNCWAYSDCNPAEYQLAVPMFWIASKLGDNSVLYRQMERVEAQRKNGTLTKILSSRYLPAVLIWAPENITRDCANAPKERLYTGRGVTPIAIIRNHFGGDDEIFMGLKCGADSCNHSHMDVGSFVMSCGRQNWFTELVHQDYYSVLKHGIDLYNRSQYSPRWKVCRDGMYSHNLVVFSDSLQRVEKKAWIDKSGDRKNFVYAASDLTAIQGVPLKSYWRGIAVADNRQAVVRDEIAASTADVPVRWAAITGADVEILDDATARLTMDGRALYVRAEGPGVKLETYSTQTGEIFDEPNPGTCLLGFSTVVPAGKKADFTVSMVPAELWNGNLRKIGPIRRW